MSMTLARILVLMFGIVIPYVASSLGGMPYRIGDFPFVSMFNAIAWGSILGISYRYRHPASLLAPSALGFGYLAWAHGVIGLGTDAQSAIALVWIPIYSLVPIAVGGVIGYVVDRRLRNNVSEHDRR